MANKWVLVKDGVVQNMIVPPEASDQEAYRNAILPGLDLIDIVDENLAVEVGWLRVDDAYVAPAPAEE